MDNESVVEKMDYVVDLQGFRRSSNIFVCKELAIIPLLESRISPEVYLFKPPCKWNRLFREEKRVNLWLEKKFHKIPWNSGIIPAKNVIKVLHNHLKDSTTIYVKGLQKKNFIEEVLPEKTVCNVEDMDAPVIERLATDTFFRCNHHTSNRHVCAGKNALALKQWVLRVKHLRLLSPQLSDNDDTEPMSEDDDDDDENVVDCTYPSKDFDREILFSMYN